MASFKNAFMFSHHFILLNMMESRTRVRISQKAVSVIHDVCVYLLQLFSFFSTSVCRLAKNNGSSSSTNNNERITNSCLEKDSTKCRETDKVADGVDPNEYFRLKFPTLKRIDKGKVASEVNDINGSRKSLQDWNETGGVSKHNQFSGGVENQTNEEFRACLDNILFGNDAFLSSRDFRGELELHQVNDKMELESELSGYEEDRGSSEGPDDESSTMDFWSEKDISTNADNVYCAPCIAEVAATGKEGDNNEEPVLSSSSSMDNEKVKTTESMREHQELIEQLRMELKRSRIPSMPTIVEEAESPRILDDSKQLKTTENLLHERHMLELQKVFKIYREKMRRFDILNYQKMHSMGFLQLKNHAESSPTRDPSVPKLKSLVSKNIWMYSEKRHFKESNKKLIDELQVDLEVVYVGQMCLSWEFLNWQYQKALDLCDSDPYEIHEYDVTSGEFHQFQMLLQRFIDDEPLQGNRVEHFIQSRCVLCKLLQVPVIKEDSLKHRGKEKFKDAERRIVVTIDKLVRTVEESIRIFWQFVRADTHCIAANDRLSRKSEPLNSRDLKLLTEVRMDLHKKRKKLKEILKEEKCILKKLKQSTEDDSEDDEDLYFLCQVDFLLVSRVLNMPKITREQLLWCCDKLNKISFMDKKVYVEPALLFFPY